MLRSGFCGIFFSTFSRLSCCVSSEAKAVKKRPSRETERAFLFCLKTIPRFPPSPASAGRRANRRMSRLNKLIYSKNRLFLQDFPRQGRIVRITLSVPLVRLRFPRPISVRSLLAHYLSEGFGAFLQNFKHARVLDRSAVPENRRAPGAVRFLQNHPFQFSALENEHSERIGIGAVIFQIQNYLLRAVPV